MKKVLLTTLIMMSLNAIGQNVMSPELLWKLGRVTPLGLSKDEKNVVYKVSTPSVADNKSTSKLYTIPVNGGKATEIKEVKLKTKLITKRGDTISYDLKSFESWLARNQAEKLVKEIVFWDIENIGPGTDKNTSKISSMVKVKGNWGGIQEGIYRVEFLFQKKKDGAPSILSFQIYDPINQNNRLELGI
mgnify:CR=1 FL=1